jgi:hypothetical protein
MGHIEPRLTVQYYNQFLEAWLLKDLICIFKGKKDGRLEKLPPTSLSVQHRSVTSWSLFLSDPSSFWCRDDIWIDSSQDMNWMGKSVLYASLLWSVGHVIIYAENGWITPMAAAPCLVIRKIQYRCISIAKLTWMKTCEDRQWLKHVALWY